MKNAFNQTIPEDVLADKEVREYVKNTLDKVIETLGVTTPIDVLGLSERDAHFYLKEKGVTSGKISDVLSGRAELIYQQIKKHLKGQSVLDLGCGDGKVGERISKEGMDVVLTDIYKHDHIESTGLEFVTTDNRQYDNTLLLTVLHHSSFPEETLAEAKRRTKKEGNIILIESVYGIDENDIETCNMSADIVNAFKALPTEKQRLVNIFFDHFYNRIIHHSEENKVNVPYNFRQPRGGDSWERIFAKQGLEQTSIEYLGIDQPSVPEYHTLHVVKAR